MLSELSPFTPIAQAVSALLYPYGEVVLHDLKTQRIAAIFNNFSKRKVGDESLLQEFKSEEKFPDVFPIYTKINWDGRNLKSVTATLRNHKGIPIGLFCINLDTSKWEEMGHLLLSWAQAMQGSEKTEVLFKDDWRERINTFVSEHLKKKGLNIKRLSREEKKHLVCSLHREGAFQAKNAAHYVADVLDISRASIYNYLREK